MNSNSSPLTRDRSIGWKAILGRLGAGLLAYLLLTGLSVRLLPFSPLVQWSVLFHTVVGIAAMAPIGIYLWRHWKFYRADALTPSKVIGYMGLAAVVAAVGTGLWATALAAFSDRVPSSVRMLHLIPSVALAVLAVAHVVPSWRRLPPEVGAAGSFLRARRGYLRASVLAPTVLLLLAFPASLLHDGPRVSGRLAVLIHQR